MQLRSAPVSINAMTSNSKSLTTNLILECHFWILILLIRFNRLFLGLSDGLDQLSNKILSRLVSSLVPSDSLDEMASFCWKLYRILLIFSTDISSSKILSFRCKSLIRCLIWLISYCKSWRVISCCLFLNLSKVFVRLIIGLSCCGLVS